MEYARERVYAIVYVYEKISLQTKFCFVFFFFVLFSESIQSKVPR